MIKTYLIFACLFIHFALIAQNNSLEGRIYDQLNHNPVVNASISVVSAEDSLLRAYTRSDLKGYYNISDLDTGWVNVYYYYPGFLINMETVHLTSVQKLFQIDTLELIKQDQMLGEVTILDAGKIKIKGDTIQFTADSFKVSANATAEDLLKKLPGLQVNSKGVITAMGQEVKKVFVDGEEFFGSDPTIATKNIQAKAIDKVQVFDKKSDAAEMTGIEDGEKIKAINLLLKDQYKEGYFGKISAGFGATPFYYNNTVLGQFYQGKSKYGLYGIISNTGTTNLSFEDSQKYMGTGGMSIMSTGSNISMTYTSDDDFSWDGQYNGEGIPKSKAIGGSYSTKVFKDKLKINANYGFSNRENDLEKSDFTKQFLPNTFLIFENDRTSHSSLNKHSGLVNLDYQLDSFTTIKYNINISKSNNSGISTLLTNNKNNEDKILSSVDRKGVQKSGEDRIGQTLNFSKKFRKQGRFIYLYGNYTQNEKVDSTLYNSYNQYFIEHREERLDQNRIREINNRNYAAKLVYTEPLTTSLSLSSTIYRNGSYSNSSFTTNNKNPETNLYDQKLDSLSNHFIYDNYANGAGLNLSYSKDKLMWGIGTSFENNNFALDNRVQDTVIRYDINKWLPNGFFTYRFTRTSRININYNGSTKPPDITQLQPLRDNTDPLNIVIGNPQLRQEYNQSIGISYNFWKALTGQSFWGSIHASNTLNNISERNTIDASGRSITTFENTNGNYSASVYASFDQKINKKIRLSVGTYSTFMQNVSYINNIRTEVQTFSLGPQLETYIDIEDKMNINISYNPSWNRTTGGVISNEVKYYSHEIEAGVEYKFSKSLSLKTNANIIQQNAQTEYDKRFDQVLWNGTLSYSFMKDKQLELMLTVHDILNNNKGLRRYTSSQTINETRYNTIQRYGMITLVYNFKNQAKDKKSDQ